MFLKASIQVHRLPHSTYMAWIGLQSLFAHQGREAWYHGRGSIHIALSAPAQIPLNYFFTTID